MCVALDACAPSRTYLLRPRRRRLTLSLPGVESLGGGFVLQHDRFVSYRAIGKHVLLWETPVHESSADKPASGKASLAIELPGTLHLCLACMMALTPIM